MVVRVKPLGHFAGVYAGASRVAGRTTSGDAEIAVDFVATRHHDPFGNIAKHETRVEDLVVEREIANRGVVQIGLQLPVTFAQLCAA